MGDDARPDLTGHSEAAYDFFDAAWPGDGPAKREFLAQFRQQLAASPYVDAIEALGHPPLARPRARP